MTEKIESSGTTGASGGQLSGQVLAIQSFWGLSFGFYIFTFGLWYFDRFEAVGVKAAMIPTATLLIIRQGSIAVLEAPTGALADSWSRKWMILIGLAGRGLFYLGLLAMAFVESDVYLGAIAIASSVVFAIGHSCFNGAFSAWIIDECEKSREDAASLITSGHRAMFITELLGGVISLVLFLQGLPVVSYVLGTICCAIAAIYVWKNLASAWVTAAPKSGSGMGLKGSVGELVSRFRALGRIIRHLPSITAITFLFASVMFLVNIVDYLWPVAVRDQLGIDERQYLWIGVIVAIGIVRIKGASFVLSAITKHLGDSSTQRSASAVRKLAVGVAGIAGLAVILLAWAHSEGITGFWMLAGSVVLVILAHGVIAPSYESLVNYYLPAEEHANRATVLSLGSLVRSIMIVLLAIPASGNDPGSTVIGWAIPGGMVVVAAIVAHFALSKAEMNLQKRNR